MPGMNITKKNFFEHLPLIKEKINQAAFISIDSEFTGLTINKHTKSSLFDTAEDRYHKSKRNVSQFTVIQFGLTAFISVGTNSYEAHTYNFYLFPEPVAGLDTRFSFQASAVQFLCQYGFDFNKVMYDGIPYLNKKEERSVREYMKSNIGNSMDWDSPQKELLRGYCSKIARWLVQARDGDVFTLEKNVEDGDVELCNEILHPKLVHRIDGIWPRPSANNVIILEKVSVSRRAELMESSPIVSTDNEKFAEHSLGFTNVINHLIEKQKVIVGHNLYLDLMLMYDKFIDPLPNSYKEFKERLHGYLPHIYDTKFMSLQLRRGFEGTVHEYDYTSLSDLYNTMTDSKSTRALLYPPTIIAASSPRCGEGNSNTETETKGQIHEAGHDSYMCGYVFLRLSHLVALSKMAEGLTTYPIPFYDYSQHICQYENRVNLIRAMVHNIYLGGLDPEASRTERLFVKTKPPYTLLRPEEVSLLLSSYGVVDISSITQNKAIVIVSNRHCARRILEAFKSHNKFAVVRYSPWRHSVMANRFLWTGAILTAGICTVALIRNARKRLFP